MKDIKDSYFLYFTLFYFFGSVYGACPPMLKDVIPLFTTYDPTKTYTGVSNEHVLPNRRSLSVKEEATTSPPPVQETTTDKIADKEEKITIQEVFDKFSKCRSNWSTMVILPFEKNGITSFTELCRTTGEEVVIIEVFLNNTFKDKCISKHNQDFWKIKSSESKIKPNPAEPTKNSIFVRKYDSKEEGNSTFSGTNSEPIKMKKVKQLDYEATGKLFMQPGTPYISWDAQGGIQGYKKHEQKSGQIYILDIQNVDDKEFKSLITYYSCFEGNDFLNDNIYISQTMQKYNTGKEVTVKEAIENVKDKLTKHKIISFDSKAWTIECYA